MRLGLQLGYWGAAPPDNAAELVAEAERAGFDGVFAAESWGSDAFTPLSWWGSGTDRVRLGTEEVRTVLDEVVLVLLGFRVAGQRVVVLIHEPNPS